MEEGARKRRRPAEAAADRISALPDHLLHEILAFLPARQAVGTSLLSRRWWTVWTTAPDVSFTTELSPSFVDSVLRLRDPAVPLRSFSLVAASADEVVSDPDPALLRSWILRATSSPDLQRLALRLPGRFDLLPPAVFHLPSLKVLELRLSGRLDWPAAAFLPSLQRLELSDLSLLYLGTEDAISNSCPALKCWRMSFESATPELEVKCPLLEGFELRTRAGPIGGLSICGRKIRKVSVRQMYDDDESSSGPAAAAYLKLSAPGLQTLEWLCPLPLSATVVDSLPDSLASSLMLLTSGELLHLDKNILPNYGHVLPLLRVDRLVLPHCWIIEEFSVAIFHRHDQENPRAWVHENLKHLELICFFEGFGSLGLAFLLKNFSKLETLRVSCVKESCINYAIHYTLFHILFKNKGGFGRGGYWDSHNSSLKQLVQVSVHDFSGERFEYDFLEFLPRAAPSLRMITIYADSEEIVTEKVEQLQQSFPHIEILLQLHGR